MMRNLKKRILIAVMGITFIMNAVMAYANESIEETYAPGQSVNAQNGYHYLGESPDNSLRFYFFPVKSAGEIKIRIDGLTNNNKVLIALEGDNEVSENTEIKPGKTSAVFYVKKSNNYILRIINDSKNTVKAYYSFAKRTSQGGSSFSKAVTLKKGVKKSDVFGFDTPVEKKQYYKFKITKEELVKIKMTKGDSCLTADELCVKVYKSNNKKNVISKGNIYEGQKSATLYIRNSRNYKTAPGTYYVVVSKWNMSSNFDYSLTWLR